ncbi:hypothetical protein [Microseira sp. BLCC-F43]|uniref:hypothetical protein n=1 Tax=Microseira sp. BLCC-F43 TaxID=3153602 RepID=UPI0035BA6EE7
MPYIPASFGTEYENGFSYFYYRDAQGKLKAIRIRAQVVPHLPAEKYQQNS